MSRPASGPTPSRLWGSVIRGRNDEQAALNELLERARVGQSGVLALRGAAGIGKSALLEYVVSVAPDMTVLSAAGIESEMELPFAGLHQLCAPLLGDLSRLPAPQRAALQTIFGLSDGPAPDRLLVGLSVLSLLADAAEKQPILCTVDDAQWLDEASALAFSFVARRLLAEPIVMLFATREISSATAGSPELLVDGLSDADARALLASAIPGMLDERIAQQILSEARGNPLALLELPRGTAPGELAGGFGLPGAFSLEGKIEESFLHRLATLPGETQTLLLLAAAEPLGDPALLWAAAEGLSIGASALVPAESAGLLTVDPHIRFHHPLVRSAVYGAASPEARRQVHRALSDATDAHAEPELHAWHLAAATPAPVESVATELESAAGKAQARGGVAAAAAFLERAAALTPDAALRSKRTLAAAQTKYEAGALDASVALLSRMDHYSLDNGQQARAHLLRAQIAFAARRGNDAPALLLKAAQELETTDPALARATYLEAMSAATFAGRLADEAGVVEVSRAVLAAPLAAAPQGPSDLLLHGLAVRHTEGYAQGAPILKEALLAFQRDTSPSPEEARWLWFASWTALNQWDDEAWTVLSTRQLDLVRQHGPMTTLPLVLSNRSSVYAFLGDLKRAESLEEELRAVTEATGTAQIPFGAMSLAALRGRRAEFAELAENVISDATERGEGLMLEVNDFLSGTLHNGLSHYADALSAVSEAEVFPNDGPAIWALTELIEAAARSGQPERGIDALGFLVETTQATRTDWGLGIEARCRALLSSDDGTESLYQEAVQRLAGSRIRVQHARAHLLYGEWLRRQRRRADAREQLRTAHEMFTEMGTEGFAERAARELLATGESARKRDVTTRVQLTPQEAQIAQLARDGLSNPEIGARLFISKHTVEYHLHKVFAKLGISSRSKLVQVLPAAD